MELLEKIIDYAIWILIVGSIIGFAYGCYDIIDIFFIRE